MTAATKICSRCGDCKPLTLFVIDSRTSTGFAAHCRACAKEYRKAWYEKNKDCAIRAANAWAKENPTRRREIVSAYMERNPAAKEKQRERARRRYSGNVNGLSDVYVKQRLCRGSNMSHCDIPQPLVEAKRLELSIKRLVKKETLK